MVEQKEESPEEAERREAVALRPALEQMYNLLDFEAVAKRVMKRTAWAYYSSAADDEIVSCPRLLPPVPDVFWGFVSEC